MIKSCIYVHLAFCNFSLLKVKTMLNLSQFIAKLKLSWSLYFNCNFPYNILRSIYLSGGKFINFVTNSKSFGQFVLSCFELLMQALKYVFLNQGHLLLINTIYPIIQKTFSTKNFIWHTYFCSQIKYSYLH